MRDAGLAIGIPSFSGERGGSNAEKRIARARSRIQYGKLSLRGGKQNSPPLFPRSNRPPSASQSRA